MSAAPHPFAFALIGAGSVGTAVARGLTAASHKPIGVASRSAASAQRAADELGSVTFDLAEPVTADVYLIGTPLDAVPSVAEQLLGEAAGSTFVHFAGTAGIEPLRRVIDAGGHACALHPVQACPDVESALRNLPGSAWGVTCSPGMEGWCERFVTDLDGIPIAVKEADRAVWHAAAVVTSNGIAGLIAGGELMLEEIGIESPEKIFGPLAAGTIANARLGGGGAATLTGPVVRGEVDTIKSHIDRLRDGGDDLVNAYRDASLVVLSAAKRAGRIGEAEFRQMSESLQ